MVQLFNFRLRRKYDLGFRYYIPFGNYVLHVLVLFCILGKENHFHILTCQPKFALKVSNKVEKRKIWSVSPPKRKVVIVAS